MYYIEKIEKNIFLYYFLNKDLCLLILSMDFRLK